MSREINYVLTLQSKKVKTAIEYLLSHFQRDYELVFNSVSSRSEGDISIGVENNCDFVLSKYAILFLEKTKNEDFLLFSEQEAPLFITQHGTKDYLLSSFFLLSGIQEWTTNKADKWGRFPYNGSVQAQFGGARENWVDLFFEKIYESITQKLHLPSAQSKPTRILLTHDIDHLKWPVLQNGYSFIKGLAGSRKKRWLSKLPLLLKNTRRNIEDIMALEDQYGVNSVFFWLTIQGKGRHGIKNADYSLEEQYVQKMMAQITKRGGSNGLHKSTQPIPMVDEFKSNLELMPINRYHYLLCNLPSDSEEINQSVKQDYTLGFAEEMGFRNSYSRPYHPFDFKNWKPFQFLEVPLHIMDTTFRGYKKLTPEEAEEEILFFLSKHSTNCCLSLLWHNDFFTPFKFDGWGKVYENILHFLFEENLYQSITPQEIDFKYRIY